MVPLATFSCKRRELANPPGYAIDFIIVGRYVVPEGRRGNPGRPTPVDARSALHRVTVARKSQAWSAIPLVTSVITVTDNKLRRKVKAQLYGSSAGRRPRGVLFQAKRGRTPFGPTR